MDFMILGPTALEVDGQRVPLGVAKQRGFLALLLYHAGEPVRVDLIIEHLWGDQRPQDRRANLHPLVSRARGALNKVGLGNALVRVDGMSAYRLDIDPGLIDFHRFQRMVDEARNAARNNHHEAAVTLLTRAIALWRGEPVADLRGSQSEHIRRNMNEAFFDAHRLLADSQLKLGKYHTALARLEPIMRANDLDDVLAQHWITALCAVGRYPDARRFFLEFRRRFRKEMQAEPAVHLPGLAGRTRASTKAGREPGALVAAGPNQLPKDIKDFIGQEDLLAELDQLMDPDAAGENIVVVVGMPGVGKTTLVTHWAHQRRHRFPDGQLYLNGRAYGPTRPVEPEEALGRFLRSLDVPADRVPADEQQRRDRLNQILTGRRVLIVLDNIRDSDQARRIIPATHSCVTLITSRSRLKGLTIRDAARTITVLPLPDAGCVKLLRQVVGERRTDAEPQAVQALAKLSGGLPLALRVIGEHVSVHPRARIADLAEELNGQLLNAPSEDEASLHSVFAWSYNALSPDAARLFRMLGLFPGSTISPETAAALLGLNIDYTEQLLNTLAKANLIMHDTVRRYVFHDLLRLYAREQACREESADNRLSAMRRLLDWYVLSAANAAAVLAPGRSPLPDLPAPDDVEELSFATDRDALRWCEAERGNLGAVTRWAVSNGYHRHAWQIPGAVHEVFDRYGRQNDVLELHQLALSAVRADGHVVGQVATLNNFGFTCLGLHDYRRATAYLEAGLRLAQEIGHVEFQASCSHNLASVHLTLGETATAVRIYRQVLAICRQTDHQVGQASALHGLGVALMRLGQEDQAAECLHEALAIRERLGSLRGQGRTHRELAVLRLAAGQVASAADHCQRALDLLTRTKDEAARCDALITMCDIELDRQKYEAASRNASRAVSLSEDIGDSPRRCRALAALASALLALGREDESRRMWTQALAIAEELHDPDTEDVRERIRVTLAATKLAPGSKDGPRV